MYFWERVGRPARTYLQQLSTNTGCSIEDLWKQWMIRTSGVRGLGKSMPAACYDDYIYIYGRYSWYNDYHCRKWIWWPEFKSWMTLFTFHIMVIPLGKVWIHLFSLQLWVNSMADSALSPWYGNQSRRRKSMNLNLLNST